MKKGMLFLDIVVFGMSKNDIADALEHALTQVRMGTPSESCSWEDGSHVTFDVMRADPKKYSAYVGDGEGVET